MTISEKIRLILRRNELTITALAAAMGITRQYLSTKLRNNDFSIADLEKIASVTGCQFDYSFTTNTGEKI